MNFITYVRYFISFFNYFCMAFTILLSIIYIVQLIMSFVKVRKNDKARQSNDFGRYVESENLLPISLLIPAYNEEENIVSNIKSLLKIDQSYLCRQGKRRQVRRAQRGHKHIVLPAVCLP